MRRNKENAKHLLISIALCVLFSACAQKQIADSQLIQSEAAELASNSEEGVSDVISEVSDMLAKAAKAELMFYAPLHINNAKAQMEQAKDYQESPPKEQPNAAMISAIAAKKIVAKAYEIKEQVINNLKGVLAAKSILDELDVQSMFASDYENSLDSLQELIMQVEAGALSEAIANEQDVIAQMAKVEIKFLLRTHLQKAKDYLKEAYEVEADDYAPVSFIAALNKIESAEKYIRENNRNRIGVKKAGEDALLAVQQAYFIAIDSKAIVNMIPGDAENHIVTLKTGFNTINKHLSQEELPPQQIKTSVAQLAAQAKDLSALNSQTQRSLALAEGKISTLSAQVAEERAKDEQDQLADAEWLAPVEDDDSESFEMMEEE